MRVIILDLDGVLNCSKTHNPRKLPYVIDPTLLRRFERLLERTRAKVVLSSTWRYDPASLFSAKRQGIRFIGTTPDMPRKPRRNEILGWLKGHPKVARYVVIDDDDDELDELPLFQPSATTGLTDDIVKGVVDYLNGKTDKDMRSSRVTRNIENIHASLTQHRG